MSTKAKSVGRTGRIVRGLFLGILGVLGFVLALVCAALIFVLARPGVIREPVNQVLAGVVAGNIEITRIDSIRWDGIRGAEGRLVDASGRAVAHVYEVSAEISWLSLVREIISSDASLDIVIVKLKVGHLHLDVSQNAEGEIAFIEALIPPPSETTAPGRDVTITFDAIQLEDGWVHGSLGDALALDTKIHSLGLSLSVAEELKIDGVRLVADVREPQKYQGPVELQGNTRLAFHDDETTSGDSSFLQTLSSSSVLDLKWGKSTAHVVANQEREAFDVTLDSLFAGTEAQRFGVNLAGPLQVKLNAVGNLDDIKAKLDAEYEKGRLAIDAHAKHEKDWKLDGSLAVSQLDLGTFGVEQISPLSAEAKFTASRLEDSELAELERYSASVQGNISSFVAKNQPVPALHFDVALRAGQLDVKAESPADKGETKIAVTTRLDSSGELDKLAVSGQLAAKHAVPYVPELQHVEGTLRFSGDVSLKAETVNAEVDARLANLRVNGGVTATSIAVDARAAGSFADPRLQAQVDAKDLRIGQETIEQVRLRLDGSLTHAHLAVSGTSRGLTAGIEGDVGVDEGEVRATDISGVVAREGNRLGLSVGALSVNGTKVEFDEVLLSGIIMGQLSGSVEGENIQLRGSLRDVSLFQVGQLAGTKLPVSGQFDADVDATLNPVGIVGRIRVEGTELVVDEQLIEETQAPVPPLTPLRLSLNLVGEGNIVTAFVHLREMADVKRQPFEIDAEVKVALPARANWNAPLIWWEHLLRLRLKGDGPLKESSRALLPKGWLAEGNLRTMVRLTRSKPRDTPRFSARVATTGLRLVFTKPTPNGTVDGLARDTLEDVDLDVRVRHDPARQHSRARVRLVDQGKRPWLRVRTEVVGSLDRLMAIRSLADLRQLGFELEGEIPKRDVKSWPKLVQIEGLRGVWGGEFSAKGTLERPEAEIRLRFSDWHATDRRTDFNLSGGASVVYDGQKLEAETNLSGENGEEFVSEAVLMAPWNARELRPEPAALSLSANLERFPLQAVGALELQNIRGPVDLKVEVKDWGTPRRHAELQLELGEVLVSGISLEGTKAKVIADARRMSGDVSLRHAKFFLEGKGEIDLEPSKAWAPAIGESMSGELKAKNVPLQLLGPLVSSQLAGLAGALSAQIKASQRADARSVEAAVQIRDGRVQVPSIGQRLHDIDLDLVWDRQGSIRLKEATFRGTSGRGKLEAEAKMRGIEPQSAKLRLIVARNERLPISLFGLGTGEFWGDIRNEFNFDWEKKTIAIKTGVKEFQLRFPELPTDQLQSLESDEHILVGTRDGQGDWIEVALQPIAKPSEDAPWSIQVGADLGKKFWLQQGPTRRIQLGGALKIDAAANEEVRVAGQLHLARGRIEINGRMFEVREGTITFQPEEPENPVIVATARWESPDGITVIARFEGPVKSGVMTLTSDPPLPEDQVLSLLLFGDTGGLGSVGNSDQQSGGVDQAATVGGSVASQGLNQALSRIEGVDLSTRVAGGDSGNVRPEVVIQLTNSLSAEVGYNLQEPSPGKSPDRTLLSLELRVIGGHSLSATVGDRGSSLVDWVWRYRY